MSSRLRRKRRQKRPKKRLDMTDIAQTFEDHGFARGFFSCLAVVEAAEDGGPHFDLDGTDLTVEVSLMPRGTPLTVRVGTVAGGDGSGIWKVPPAGAEVLVCIPDGDLAFQPVIAQWYSGGSLPEDIGETTLVIAAPPGGRVYIHDGSGNVDQLVTKSAFAAHKHPETGATTGVPDNALDDASYTDVLRSK